MSPEHIRQRVKANILAFMWATVSVSQIAAQASDVPIRGDAGLLNVLRDAQITAESQYKRGSLTAEIHEEWTVGLHSHSLVKTVWDGESMYWEVDYHREGPRSGATFDYFNPRQRLKDSEKEAQDDRVVWIETPRMSCAYFPGDRPAATIRLPPNKVSYRLPIFQFRPEVAWLAFERNPDLPWRRIFDPSRTSPPLELIVESEGDDLVVVESHREGGEAMKVFASLAHGGRVTRYEHTPRAPSELEPQPQSTLVGRFDWEQLPSGTWVVRTVEQKHVYPDKDGELIGSYRMKLLDYDPNPKIPNDRFEITSLKFAPGTRVLEIRGVKPNGQTRTYRVGEDAELPEELLDRLAEELSAEGFANPNTPE